MAIKKKKKISLLSHYLTAGSYRQGASGTQLYTSLGEALGSRPPRAAQKGLLQLQGRITASH